MGRGAVGKVEGLGGTLGQFRGYSVPPTPTILGELNLFSSSGEIVAKAPFARLIKLLLFKFEKLSIVALNRPLQKNL